MSEADNAPFVCSYTTLLYHRPSTPRGLLPRAVSCWASTRLIAIDTKARGNVLQSHVRTMHSQFDLYMS